MRRYEALRSPAKTTLHSIYLAESHLLAARNTSNAERQAASDARRQELDERRVRALTESLVVEADNQDVQTASAPPPCCPINPGLCVHHLTTLDHTRRTSRRNRPSRPSGARVAEVDRGSDWALCPTMGRFRPVTSAVGWKVVQAVDPAAKKRPLRSTWAEQGKVRASSPLRVEVLADVSRATSEGASAASAGAEGEGREEDERAAIRSLADLEEDLAATAIDPWAALVNQPAVKISSMPSSSRSSRPRARGGCTPFVPPSAVPTPPSPAPPLVSPTPATPSASSSSASSVTTSPLPLPPVALAFLTRLILHALQHTQQSQPLVLPSPSLASSASPPPPPSSSIKIVVVCLPPTTTAAPLAAPRLGRTRSRTRRALIISASLLRREMERWHGRPRPQQAP